MNHEKRGVFLVINIRKYKDNRQEERKWSVKDYENLQHTFRYLEFDVRPYEDLTAKEIKDVIEKIADEDHTNSDCFLCVVMSHGNDEKIVTSDNQKISFDEIMAPIKECPTLIDKPKLFFFQACRGKNEMVNRQDSDESTPSRHTETDDASIVSTTTASSHSSNPKKRTFIKFEADLLVFYATKKHFYAFVTETNEGTIFIESVCEVFNNAYTDIPKNLSLSQMLMKINANVEEKGGKQLTDLNLNFKKEVYFTPKNVSLNLIKKIINWFLDLTYQKINFRVLSLESLTVTVTGQNYTYYSIKNMMFK